MYLKILTIMNLRSDLPALAVLYLFSVDYIIAPLKVLQSLKESVTTPEEKYSFVRRLSPQSAAKYNFSEVEVCLLICSWFLFFWIRSFSLWPTCELVVNEYKMNYKQSHTAIWRFLEAITIWETIGWLRLTCPPVSFCTSIVTSILISYFMWQRRKGASLWTKQET